MKTLLLIFLLLLSKLSAQVLISPFEAMQANYGYDTQIAKKNILLSNAKFIKIQKDSQTKLDTKIYRIYTAKRGDILIGYGILINRKVRSKNAVTLYMIHTHKLQSIEIIAFNEPLEYLPTNSWQAQFKNNDTATSLMLHKEIPTITGATLSAKSITEGSRVAFALYNELLKER